MQSKFRGWIIGVLLAVCGLSLYAQSAASAHAGLQFDCPRRPSFPIRQAGLALSIMDRICKLAMSGAQTPQPAGDLTNHNQVGTFAIFDPPGSTDTNPSAITADGTIIGSYLDASGLTHGFLRTPGGAYATIDVPGAASSIPTSITPGGVIAGWYCAASCFPFPSPVYGFLRAADGTFTTFTPPADFLFPGIGPSINPAGDVVGTYWESPSSEHGYLRSKNGAFTTIDVPGAITVTEARAINPAGVIVGDFFDSCNSTICTRGFLRTPDGTFTAFDPPGSDFTWALAINPAGAIMGVFDNVGFHGFLRAPDGRFTAFDPPGSELTWPLAINSAGAITGYYCDAVTCHGFVRTPSGTITSFDPPGSAFSFGTAINSAGVISGEFYDSGFVGHGFVYGP